FAVIHGQCQQGLVRMLANGYKNQTVERGLSSMLTVKVVCLLCAPRCYSKLLLFLDGFGIGYLLCDRVRWLTLEMFLGGYSRNRWRVSAGNLNGTDWRQSHDFRHSRQPIFSDPPGWRC